MTDSDPIQRVKLRVGEFELDTEGPASIVKAQFEAFMALVNSRPVTAAASAAPAPGGSGTGNGVITPPPPPPAPGLTQEIMDRVFQARGDSLSLLALPTDTTGADALLVLLYGFSRLKGIQNVTGVSLMAAANQSGVQIPRIDRVIDSRSEYITAGGSRRGKRYGLNNRGVKYAEEVITGLVQ